MGTIFSCLASTFIYLGEFLENIFLALGEIGAVLVRCLTGIVVSLCDLLACMSCCYRVPWSDRPDRSYYTFSTMQDTNFVATNGALASVGGKKVLRSVLTKEGREQRRQNKEAKRKVEEMREEDEAAKEKVEVEKDVAGVKV